MMGLRTTLILFALVIGALCFFLFRTAQQPVGREYEEQKRRVFPAVEYEDIKNPYVRSLSTLATRLELRSASGRVVLERKSRGTWFVLQPFAAIADRAKVGAILREIESLEAQRTLTKAKDGPLALGKYGLAEPRCALTFTVGEKSWTLWVGDKSLDDKNVYVARPDLPATTIYVVPTAIICAISMTAAELSDRQALRFDPSQVIGLVLQPALRPSIECRSEKGQWRIVAPINDVANSRVIDALLYQLSALTVQPEDFFPDMDIEKAGAHSPSLTIGVVQGNDSLLLFIGADVPGDSSKVFAKRGGESLIFALPKAVIQNFLLSADSLRLDSALQFNSADVIGLQLRLKAKTLGLARVDSHWRATPKDDFVPDDEQVFTLLNDLREHRVQKWIDAPSPKEILEAGLSDPQVCVEIELQSGRTDSLRIGRQIHEGTLCYAQREPSGPILLLSSAVLKRLVSAQDTLLSKIVLEFPRTDVIELRIARQGQHLRLKRQQGEWRLVEPVSGTADSQVVDMLLWNLCHVEAQRRVTGGKMPRASYGLDPPCFRVAIVLSPGTEANGEKPRPETRILLVGSDLQNESGSRYAAIEGRDEIFVIGKTLAELLRAEFASTIVFSPTPSAIATVEISESDPLRTGRFQKTPVGWYMTRPREEEAKQPDMRRLLGTLGELRAESIAEYDVTKAEMKQYGLEPPRIVLRVETTEGVKNELWLGKEENGVLYVWRIDAPFVFRVKMEKLAAVFAATARFAPPIGAK